MLHTPLFSLQGALQGHRACAWLWAATGTHPLPSGSHTEGLCRLWAHRACYSANKAGNETVSCLNNMSQTAPQRHSNRAPSLPPTHLSGPLDNPCPCCVTNTGLS
uniref:Uncharacterized protein n=1 Tax=Catharus ustulatus TaxID=91951 RepID=A0A8C3V190_CATUS